MNGAEWHLPPQPFYMSQGQPGTKQKGYNLPRGIKKARTAVMATKAMVQAWPLRTWRLDAGELHWPGAIVTLAPLKGPPHGYTYMEQLRPTHRRPCGKMAPPLRILPSRPKTTVNGHSLFQCLNQIAFDSEVWPNGSPSRLEARILVAMECRGHGSCRQVPDTAKPFGGQSH
jgi:hypothetical protein